MIKKLKDICQIEKGQQIDTDLLDDSKPYKYINGGIRESGFYDEYNTKGTTITVSEGGASCGYVNIIDEPFWCGCHCYKLTQIKVQPKYLYFNLKANQGKIMSLRTGSAMPNIRKSSFMEMQINVTNSNDEQRKIVTNLEKIEEVISKSKKELLLLDEMIKSRFNEMFSKIIYSGDRETNFGSICDGIIGLTYKPDNISDEGTIVLRSGNIQNNSLQIIDDVVRVSNINIPDEKMVRDLDILMCARNGSARLVGKTCIIRNPTEQMTFGAFMTIIRTKYPYILHHYMNSDFFRIQLKSTQTASVNQITNGMLKEYSVFSPTDAEEKQFRSFVEQIDKLKFNVQKRIDYYQELLNKKMDEYFN